MPWIAKHYTSVLDKFPCGSQSPDAALVWGFIAGEVPESVLRSFLEVYPRSLYRLRHQIYEGEVWDDANFPSLDNLLAHDSQECTAEFFKWIVGEHPSTLRLRDGQDETVLGIALFRLSMKKTETMAEICKSTMDIYSEVVLEELNFSPSFGICGVFTEVEQDVVAKLLEAFSEPFDRVINFDEPTRRDLNVLRINFFRLLKLLLNELKDARESWSLLYGVKTNLTEATERSQNKMHTDLSHVFRSWSVSQMQQLQKELDGSQLAIDQLIEKYDEQHVALEDTIQNAED